MSQWATPIRCNMTLKQIPEEKWSRENVENTKDFTSDNIYLLP